MRVGTTFALGIVAGLAAFIVNRLVVEYYLQREDEIERLRGCGGC